MIHPVLEYGYTISGPFYATDINNVENIQRKATKLVPTIRYVSYEDRLRSLKVPTLQYRRHRGDMIMLFNPLHDMYDFNISDLFTFTPNNHLTMEVINLNYLNTNQEWISQGRIQELARGGAQTGR